MLGLFIFVRTPFFCACQLSSFSQPARGTEEEKLLATCSTQDFHNRPGQAGNCRLPFASLPLSTEPPKLSNNVQGYLS